MLVPIFVLFACFHIVLSICPTNFDLHYGDYCFSPTPRSGDYDSAYAGCRQQDGVMVSIHSSDDNMAVVAAAKILGIHFPVYIGYSFDGKGWAWSDGSSLSHYSNWTSGGLQDLTSRCTGLRQDGSWITVNCRNHLDFMCTSRELDDQNKYVISKTRGI